MMKKETVILLMLLSMQVFAQTSTKVFAKINYNNSESYKILADTLALKNLISKELLDNGYNIAFEKVEIKKQLTLGSKKEFFHILITSKDKKVKVSRWLSKKGNDLIINDNMDGDDFFEQIYLICIGDGDCNPNVFEDKGVRMWGCSEIVGCNAIDGEEPKCITIQSLF
ncbi:hypothetical protein GWA97_13000 [Flavobacterium sp. LaA7.5]|nr:hypothetical protein [Flavobacterium salilacus subsp. altitudinum]